MNSLDSWLNADLIMWTVNLVKEARIHSRERTMAEEL
jgi:hypothetical protein